MKTTIKLLMFLAFGVVIAGCENDDDQNDQVGTLEVAYKLVYNGEPLVLFDDYSYSNGEAISFSRVSFYVTDMALGSGDKTAELLDVSYLRAGEAHQNAAAAAKGLSMVFDKVPTGTYSGLGYRFGISDEQNDKVPADYPSSSDLSLSGEYWVGWKSYIYAKIEGRIDLDGDGQKETGLSLHLGTDDAKEWLSMAEDITISEDATTKLNISMDLFKILGAETSPLEFPRDAQIHSLNQAEIIGALADNVKQYTSFEMD